MPLAFGQRCWHYKRFIRIESQPLSINSGATMVGAGLLTHSLRKPHHHVISPIEVSRQAPLLLMPIFFCQSSRQTSCNQLPEDCRHSPFSPFRAASLTTFVYGSRIHCGRHWRIVESQHAIAVATMGRHVFTTMPSKLQLWQLHRFSSAFSSLAASIDVACRCSAPGRSHQKLDLHVPSGRRQKPSPAAKSRVSQRTASRPPAIEPVGRLANDQGRLTSASKCEDQWTLCRCASDHPQVVQSTNHLAHPLHRTTGVVPWSNVAPASAHNRFDFRSKTSLGQPTEAHISAPASKAALSASSHDASSMMTSAAARETTL